MAQTANVILQYAQFVACTCAATAYTYTPGFNYSAVSFTLGPTGAKPAYLSLKGAATTSDCYVSTGQQIWWPGLPSVSNTISFISTSSGAEVSMSVFG